jgi:hypothetical protein
MSEKQGSLREVMPQTAAWVDELRAVLGREWADRIVLRGRSGKGGFYAAEIGPDGVFREFGSAPSRRRCEAVDGKVEWTDGTH